MPEPVDPDKDSDLEDDPSEDSDTDIIGESTGVNVVQTDCSKAFNREAPPFLEAMKFGDPLAISVNLDLEANILRAYKLLFAASVRCRHGVAGESRQPLAELQTADALPITVEMRGGELITRMERIDLYAEAGQ